MKQIVVGIRSIFFRRLNQAEDYCVVLGTVGGVGKQGILSVNQGT